MYSSLKLHFKGESYDYKKYHGKVKIPVSTFEKRGDKYDFHRLMRRFAANEIETFMVANFLKDQKVWIRNLLTQDAEDVYLERERVRHSLTQTFSYDIKKLMGLDPNLDNLCSIVSGGYPRIFTEFLSGNIQIETMVILDSIFPLFEKWKKKITEPYVLPKKAFLVRKYRPFLEVDLHKYRELLKSLIRNG